ncbi:hypothetical protein HPB49_023483 [Dermacentor silvarum]|uniref:Uncharacterized protein n=1 Tax=Dermacentor silvarum TaxID=543639 RepID=A0ACB8DRF3_DERSI|nr:hypothetical protein HPB49_023483 [Dermacentor silvarum]
MEPSSSLAAQSVVARSTRLDVVEGGTVVVLAYLVQDSASAEGPTGHFAIGIHVMQMEVNRQFRVHVIKPKVCSSDLQRGRYCLLPTTFEPGQARRFLLRLFYRQPLDARELQKDVPSAKLLPCQSMPALATIIRIIGAKHLEQQDPFGSAQPVHLVPSGVFQRCWCMNSSVHIFRPAHQATPATHPRMPREEQAE